MVHYSFNKGVALIRMVHPSLNLQTRAGLLKSFNHAVHVDKAKSIILYGGSDNGASMNFSTGADITEFARGKHLTQPSLNDVIAALDTSPIPIVCGIQGYALGGGLELALACHWRLAQRKSTKLGLPEVHLGLLPGAGGTQRLPRLVGYRQALDLMTSGRHVGAEEALSLGIVDCLVDEGDIVHQLEEFSSALPTKKKLPVSSLLPPIAPTDADWDVMLQETTARAKGAEAPLAILKAVQASCLFRDAFSRGLDTERRLFESLANGQQSKALQYLFFAGRIAKKHAANGAPSPQVEPSSMGPLLGVLIQEARHVEHILGGDVNSKNRIDAVLREKVGLIHGPFELESQGATNGPLYQPDEQDIAVSILQNVRGESTSNDLHPDDVSKQVLTQPALSDDEIVCRVLYPVVNHALELVRGGLCSVEQIDLAVCQPFPKGLGFPRIKGGLLFYAERSLGLASIVTKLKEWHSEQGKKRKAYQACELLLNCVESGSTVREELFFRKSNSSSRKTE